MKPKSHQVGVSTLAGLYHCAVRFEVAQESLPEVFDSLMRICPTQTGRKWALSTSLGWLLPLLLCLEKENRVAFNPQKLLRD